MQREQNPLVSVVIPCYNAGRFIEETIHSVIAQSYENLEIVVIDDGSTDNSMAILGAIQTERTYRIYQQQNSGVSVARNKGVDLAKGKIIAFLDADDWMYPGNIAEKVALLQANNADLVYSWAEITDASLTATGIFKGADPEKFAAELFIFANPPIPSPSSVLVKRHVIINAGLFDPKLSVAADLDMWIRISFCGKVDRVPRCLIKYRIVEGSMNTNINGQIHDLEFIMDKYGTVSGVKPYIRKFRKDFYYSVIGNSYHAWRPLRLFNYLIKYLIA